MDHTIAGQVSHDRASSFIISCPDFRSSISKALQQLAYQLHDVWLKQPAAAVWCLQNTRQVLPSLTVKDGQQSWHESCSRKIVVQAG